MPLLLLALAVFLAPPQAPPPPRVPAAFRIMGELERELSTRKAKPGDTVRLVCLHDIQGESGVVYIPRGARLVAGVSAVQRFGSGQPARLSLRLTAAEWKGGRTALDGIVVTVVALSRVIETVTPPAGPTASDSPFSQTIPNAAGGTMPTVDSQRTMPTYGTPSRPNADIRTPTGTVRVRDRSPGERGLDELNQPQRRGLAVPGRIPASWGLGAVADPAIGSAITATNADIRLPKGSQLIFKTR